MLVYQRVNPLQPPLIDDFPWFFPLQTSMYRLCSTCFPLKPPFIHDFPTNTFIYRWCSLIFPTKPIKNLHLYRFLYIKLKKIQLSKSGAPSPRSLPGMLPRNPGNTSRSVGAGCLAQGWWGETGKKREKPWAIHGKSMCFSHMNIIWASSFRCMKMRDSFFDWEF